MIGSVALISVMFVYFAGRILRMINPAIMDIPLFISLGVGSLVISIFVTQFISKGIFKPIYQLHEGMQKVAMVISTLEFNPILLLSRYRKY